MRANAEDRYVSAFEVYMGKKGNSVEKGLGSKVVKCLTEELYNTYHHVYHDTSLPVWILHLTFIEPGCTAVQPSGLTGRFFLWH